MININGLLSNRADTHRLRNERGIALIIALLMLAMLGMLGIFALGSSSTELHIAGNYRNQELAFFNADVGEGFGPANQNMLNPIRLYDPNPALTRNVLLGAPIGAYVGQTNVTVQFLCISDLPAGESGSTGDVAHHFLVTITGSGANNALYTVQSRTSRRVARQTGLDPDC
jgi:hypothetical protein